MDYFLLSFIINISVRLSFSVNNLSVFTKCFRFDKIIRETEFPPSVMYQRFHKVDVESGRRISNDECTETADENVYQCHLGNPLARGTHRYNVSIMTNVQGDTDAETIRSGLV